MLALSSGIEHEWAEFSLPMCVLFPGAKGVLALSFRELSMNGQNFLSLTRKS